MTSHDITSSILPLLHMLFFFFLFLNSDSRCLRVDTQAIWCMQYRQNIPNPLLLSVYLKSNLMMAVARGSLRSLWSMLAGRDAGNSRGPPSVSRIRYGIYAAHLLWSFVFISESWSRNSGIVLWFATDSCKRDLIL